MLVPAPSNLRIGISLAWSTRTSERLKTCSFSPKLGQAEAVRTCEDVFTPAHAGPEVSGNLMNLQNLVLVLTAHFRGPGDTYTDPSRGPEDMLNFLLISLISNNVWGRGGPEWSWIWSCHTLL